MVQSIGNIYKSVDYPVISYFLFMRQLGPVNHGKKSVLDNIGPSTYSDVYCIYVSKWCSRVNDPQIWI
jgi:hypothetical protein